MLKIINGKEISQKIFKKLERKVKRQKLSLKLAVILIGNDKASISFIRKKERACRNIGIDFELFKFPGSIDGKKLSQKIRIIQDDKKLSGLVIQLPLPRHINTRKILEGINPELDVDCLTSYNLGKLTAGIPNILSPTASACLHLLKRYKVDLTGKHVVIIGRGDLVGKPLSIILTQDKNTITVCNKYTKNLKNFVLQADILISATGTVNLIKKSMIKKGAVVLDAGVGFKNGKISGDCNFKGILNKVKLITPVPGGVGPVTVAKLLENIVKLGEIRDN